MTFSDRDQLVTLYAADLLDNAGRLTAEERASIESWLSSGDPAAAAALAEANEVLGQLPLTLDSEAPSAGMWERLEAELKDEPPSEPIAQIGSTPKQGSALRFVAAAAITAIVTGGATFYVMDQERQANKQALTALQQRIDQQEQRAETSEQRANTLEAENASQQLVVEQQQERITEQEQLTQTLTQRVEASDQRATALETQAAAQTLIVERQQELIDEQSQALLLMNNQLASAVETVRFLQSPTRQTVALAGTDQMPNAKASITWDKAFNRLSFSGADFADPGNDKAYQLWFVTEQAGPVSLGVVEVDDQGRVTYDAPLPEATAGIQVVAISLEPAGGSPDPAGPTGPIMLAGKL